MKGSVARFWKETWARFGLLVVPALSLEEVRKLYQLSMTFLVIRKDVGKTNGS